MKQESDIRALIEGQTVLGIEMGSTRIKSVLLNASHEILASGSFQWENSLSDGLWTYRLADAVRGMQESYKDLAANVLTKYGVTLTKIGAIGISGMMHGYLVLDKLDRQLAPFLTWRNTNTSVAAAQLSELFQFNIPLRWSVAHLYQAILEQRPHVSEIAYMTTLAGYIFYRLSGQRVLGIGDASGMFPIDAATLDYDGKMLSSFQELVSVYQYPWRIQEILPRVMKAGECAGTLTETGAKLLDPSGNLQPGIPMVPPEGDAGTGMTATNAVEPCTGNVSAGTSIFSMVVLEKPLSRIYKDIDIVTTPSGSPVAMVHCNNGTSELDAWISLLTEFADKMGLPLSAGEVYRTMLQESLHGDPDCSNVLVFNCLSGEPVTGLDQGRPMVVRRPESTFRLANFMRSQIYSIFASLTIGMRILTEEKVRIKRLTGHGGLFKTPEVAQRYLSAAMGVPITVMETAGEGGPYGMALLAAYYLYRDEGEPLEAYLTNKVFTQAKDSAVLASKEERQGYREYLSQYQMALQAEVCAAECL